MALKKTIAALRQPDGSWSEQYDVEMHPLEEKEIRAHWAIHDVNIKIPPKPTPEEELEWMVVHGADHVKQKRDEWQKKHDEVKPELDAAHDYYKKCEKEWHDHVEFCVTNGLDKDTHDKEKYKDA